MNEATVNLIQHRMIDAGIRTWADLAQRIGISGPHMCNIVRGRRKAVKARKRLAKLLNIPESALITPTAAPGEQEPQS